MDEHVSSTTANNEEELDKLVPELGAEDTGVQENNEALAKNSVDDDEDILDLIGEEKDDKHIAEEDPPESSSSGPEPQPATEPEAPLTTDSAVAESTEEPTKVDTEDKTPEPEKEEIIDEPTTEDKILQPETEDNIVKPEIESTAVLPETEDSVHGPDAPIEAPVSLEKESHSSESAAPHEPIISSSASSQPQSLSSSANVDAPHLQSQDNVKDMDEASKDLFSSKASWYETNMLSSKAGAEDDFLFERKPSASPNNPFQSFAPIGDSSSDFALPGEAVFDSRAGKMSESPTPDLVQYAHDGESQGTTSTKHREEPLVDLVHKVSDAVVEPSDPLMNLPTAAQESDKSSTPSSLPDILKLSPLNPDKDDSGSSEGSSDCERSPIRGLQSASHSALNAFTFDSKALLLKEMAEETEARAAEKRKQDGASAHEQSFGTFDLLKEAETTSKVQGLQSMMEEEEKDWMFSSKESVKLPDRSGSPSHPSSMNLPPSPPSKNVVPEESDSESPITDSLSPVLDAMAKNPESFQVEVESRCVKDSKVTLEKEVKGLFGEEPEAHEEVSEHEVSSEEFEFVERPPKGVIDEFLETLDNSKLAKAPERGVEYDLPTFGQSKLFAEFEEVGSSPMSYDFLSQPTSKADLETPDVPSESLERNVQKITALSRGPLSRPTPEELPKPTAPWDAKEDGMPSAPARPEAPKPARLPNLSAEAVVDLLYWRDIKTTGVVFGACLFLLLSLTVCSIVSVCSYVALTLLSVTIAFRIYKGILQAIQKSDEGHPFKAYLDQDVALSEDMVHKYSDLALERINVWIVELRRLFLVDDLVDSLKFAVGMWVLTYVGALFNGLTLIILALVGVFSCPVIYEKNQKQIDHYVQLVTGQVKDIVAKVQAKVPGLKRKAE
ncbi:reticulon-4-like isoform X2 [Anguilla anguilla]|uniref:reticulon-4-like isoform X2 n=1 Tax=Anguilla anguilla TaxID=7936 RepID=UPI0015AD9C10|nr:reticulon-4-like isoform X2 [Anguilla anguilla]